MWLESLGVPHSAPTGSAQEVGWDANQHTVAVVQPGVHQSEEYQHLECGRCHILMGTLQLMQSIIQNSAIQFT